MQWFGESWNAPCCDIDEHVATPVGEFCADCTLPIGIEDQGFVIPYFGEERRFVDSFYHLDCFLTCVLGKDRAGEFNRGETI